MKKLLALSIAALIVIFAAVPAFAVSSPSKSNKDYKVVIHNTNGGTATYTTDVDEDGKHVTLVAHPKNGYEFSKWKIKGEYDLVAGDLTDEEIEVLLKSDVEVYPVYKKLGSKSTTSTSISINSGTTSPKTGEGPMVYFAVFFAVLFVVAAGAVGIKLAVSKK